jgi:hypothetical protein
VLHIQGLPGPKPPQKRTTDDDNDDNEPVRMEQEISERDLEPSASNEPYFITEGELNALLCKLNLRKSRAQFLG